MNNQNQILFTSLIDCIRSRQENFLPYSEYLRALMVLCEEIRYKLAEAVRNEPEWAAFQQAYNDPSCQPSRYREVCQKLFDNGFLKNLYELGYDEVITDSASLSIGDYTGSGKKIRIMVWNPNTGSQLGGDFYRDYGDVNSINEVRLHLIKAYKGL